MTRILEAVFHGMTTLIFANPVSILFVCTISNFLFGNILTGIVLTLVMIVFFIANIHEAGKFKEAIK